jgi:hypothetical protein
MGCGVWLGPRTCNHRKVLIIACGVLGLSDDCGLSEITPWPTCTTRLTRGMLGNTGTRIGINVTALFKTDVNRFFVVPQAAKETTSITLKLGALPN